VAQHRLRDQIVGDDTMLHRPDDLDAARRPADHVARRLADSDDGVIPRGQSDDGGLLDHHTLAFDVDEDVGRAEVDSDALKEHAIVVPC